MPWLQELWIFICSSGVSKSCIIFLLVGAGSAGGVVATRLAEHGHSVLVLEAGGEDKGLLSLSMPFGCAEPAFSKEYTWSTHKTTPQQFCGKAFKNRVSLQLLGIHTDAIHLVVSLRLLCGL